MDQLNILTTEEREFFRVNDNVIFGYRAISLTDDIHDHELQKPLFDEEEYRQFRLMQSLQEIACEQQKLVANVHRSYGELMPYLEFESQKLDAIRRYLLRPNTPCKEPVNLSVGGLAFKSKDEIPNGTRLLVKLIFTPNYEGFVADAQVVAVTYLPKVDADKPYRIQCKFRQLKSAQEDLIQRHILKVQFQNQDDD